ncbi:MAG: low molecular weight phosphatase family protein [Candidatus Bathyarchaeota archaeon]|nr:MAG: low molecular weight phosphatase family protein [Candidatus Bathyarchaeota archaeon]
MKVLFVCSGNAYRSPVAEALLKKTRPEIDADSAGIDPVIPISEAAKRYLAEETALKYLKRAPQSLGEKSLDEYDLIVAMKQEHKNSVLDRCPECTEKVVVWNIDDPYFLPHGHAKKIFKEIRGKITELASTLQGE